MIPFSGQLGNGALGKFSLATVRIVGVFTPHTQRAHSAITAAHPASALSSRSVGSAITSNSPKSEVL